jgi:hypothetical protein
LDTNSNFRTNLEDLKQIVLPESIELLSNYDKSPLLLQTGGFKEKIEMGHAMKANQKLPKIEQEVKDYIQLLFNQGQAQASNPKSVQKYSANDMVALIHKKFPKKNWLKFGQVHSDPKSIIPFKNQPFQGTQYVFRLFLITKYEKVIF